MQKLFFFFSLLLMTFPGHSQENKPQWQYLLNGNTFDGWTRLGGNATYKVQNGVVTGTTVANTPNSFLRSKKMYSDFILEVDFLVDSTLNSGIQIRSNSLPTYRNGRVHGYQVEIDPSGRAWSGGIYDEARRGWLNPLENNAAARQAFRQGEWNHYRIEAIGDTIQTWVNGVSASFLIDDMTPEGFIALQVHSISDEEEAGKEVQWKNLKILTRNLHAHSQTMNIEPIRTLNELTYDEKNNGWELLWDGVTTDGWRGAKLNHFPDYGWTIRNGSLIVLESSGAESANGGDIVTENLYEDFELKLDFKLTKGANSGIKYYVNTDLNKGEGSAIGLEYQLLDDENHPDAKLGNHEGSRTLASLYDLIAADSSKIVHPLGEWNHARIVSKGNQVSHWLNGEKVLEYTRGNEDFRQLVEESKYKVWPDFGEKEKGNILLQDHGNRVSFRNIKIKTFN